MHNLLDVTGYVGITGKNSEETIQNWMTYRQIETYIYKIPQKLTVCFIQGNVQGKGSIGV